MIPLEGWGYVGRILLMYLFAVISTFLVAFTLIALELFGLADLGTSELEIFAGGFVLIAVLIFAMGAAAWYSVIWFLHMLVMVVWMGARQRISDIKTPITDMFFHAALGYGLGLMALEGPDEFAGWESVALTAQVTLGALLGLWSFFISRRRQFTLRWIAEHGPLRRPIRRGY